jgi:purine nucleoside phosphorylase
VTIGSFDESLNEHAKENAVISLKDIPNFPVETMAGYTGKIGTHITNDTNTSIYVLSTTDLNGFSMKESAFLSLLLIKLGVQFVNFLITGEHNDPTGLETHVISLQDAFDYSTSCQPLDFIQRRLEKEGSSYPKMSEIVKNYQKDLSVSSTHSYFTMSGVSLPTPTEAKLARFGGCDIVGITDLSLMNYLHILGIPVFPIVVVPKEKRTDLNSSLLKNCVKESADEIVKLLNDIMKKASSDFEEEKEIEFKIKDDNFESKYIDSDLSNKVSYFIKMEFQQVFKEPVPKKAIIDITNALSIPKQEIVAEIDFAKIPYLGDASGKIGIWMCDKNPVLFVSANSHIHIWNNDTIVLLRAFKDLGITEIICTSFVQSISKDVKVGDLCLIKDHINLTGKNPLIGKNDESFGNRFPDMSKPYNEIMNHRIEEIAKMESKEIKVVDCLATQMCIFHSEKEIEMGTNYETQICSTSFIREIIIANHMGMKVNVCAIVSQDESDEILKEEPIKDLTKIVSSYFAKYPAIETKTN